MKNELKIATTLLGGVVTAICSTLFIPTVLLFIAQLLDYISGVFGAFYAGEPLSPSKGVKGIVKKVSLWILIFTGLIIDILFRYGLGEFGISIHLNYLTSPIIAVWLTLNEMLSILQNLGRMGITFPKFLQPLIEALVKEVEKGE